MIWTNLVFHLSKKKKKSWPFIQSAPCWQGNVARGGWWIPQVPSSIWLIEEEKKKVKENKEHFSNYWNALVCIAFYIGKEEEN